jgi:hypothetical protein
MVIFTYNLNLFHFESSHVNEFALVIMVIFLFYSKLFIRNKIINYSLQNPIKNIIKNPE